MESSQQLIGQRNSESVLATIGVMAFSINGGLVVHIGGPRQHVRFWRGTARCVLRGDGDVDRASIALLARPAVYVVLVHLERYTIDDPDHRPRSQILR